MGLLLGNGLGACPGVWFVEGAAVAAMRARSLVPADDSGRGGIGPLMIPVPHWLGWGPDWWLVGRAAAVADAFRGSGLFNVLPGNA